ncbi:response regulator transcription factor [Aliikangiella marina]|uniref:Phosphate regulon transcriptional regulatory protein PhoB n=1 Tax=Aliikangiella marina TaxID=1712262 RepID=A0A545THR7_9GAMM|nr:response regulator transcription factor [Aliikangiella marina]TQV76777.1 response regulator transcription factor [Aliikangiella marina]
MSETDSILIVEDDKDIAELLKVNLEDLSFQCDTCDRGDQAVTQIANKHYALVVLDLTLPGLNGLEVCKKVREFNPQQPILMLTAKSSELDQIIGLEAGADDYMTKPFSIPALQARVRTRIRRSKSYFQSVINAHDKGESERHVVGDLSIDSTCREVKVHEARLDLTAREFDLLKHFATHPEQVFSRSQLLDCVWGYNHDGYEHTVNSHINRLRTKLQTAVGNNSIIQTVWGVGYKLKTENCFIHH